MPPRDRIWTLLLLRSGGGRVFEWKGRRAVAAAVLAAAVLAVVAAGVGLGLLWSERRDDRRVVELRDRVRQLRQERDQVRRLAARLDSMEREYRQIRQVMAAGAGDSDGDVGLPEVPDAEAPVDGEDGAGAAPGEAETGWAWPLSQEGFVTRTHREGRSEGSEEHSGLDIAVPMGSYVRAARAGQVEAAGDDPVYGLFVRLRHADGYRSLYGHNRWLFVKDGDSVVQGEVIALSGSSGRSTAPHLHFEITGDEGSVDPGRLLEGEARPAGSPDVDTRGDGP